jgi:ubiquinone/menaquinone biosynthesis C-methylase UbiE
MERSESRYIHGSAPEEQKRLSLLNTILNHACLRELNLRGGEKILDVGSGLGQFTRAMARAAGTGGRVVGIERDPEQLAEAQRQAKTDREAELAAFRPGDAYDLPLTQDEWGGFDLAHARFLLEHLPEPSRAVEQMLRAVRPGGRVVLMDDDHHHYRIWPEPPGWPALWSAYMKSFELLGNDPFIGRRLAALLLEAGATPKRSALIPHVCCAGHPDFPAYTENLITVLTGARDAIVGPALLDATDFDAAIAALESWSRRPDAAIWYALCWAEATRPS